VREHWATYGQDIYTRHDYEEIDASRAKALVAELRAGMAGLVGTRFGDLQVVSADDFGYVDPIDGSIANAQGIRVGFHDGARIVYRLSGTGTSGATLRVYIERYEADPGRQGGDTQEALADLVAASRAIARIGEFTGRAEPSVIT
jgi:phosphoglucomutase